MTLPVLPKYTDAGLAAIATAFASGSAVNITHVAIGDGNDGGGVGGYVPDGSETELKNEIERVAVTGYQQTDNDFIVEAVFTPSVDIPLYEIGYFLDDGTLLAVWSDANMLVEIKSGISFKLRLQHTVTENDSATINFIVPNDAELRLDGLNRPTTDINWDDNLIKNLKDPANEKDAVNKRSMDAAINAATPDHGDVEASMTAVSGDVLYVFSSTENIEITLPENAANKASVTIFAKGGYPFKLMRNGATIRGDAEDLLFNRTCKAELVSFNGNWGVGITSLA